MLTPMEKIQVLKENQRPQIRFACNIPGFEGNQRMHNYLCLRTNRAFSKFRLQILPPCNISGFEETNACINPMLRPKRAFLKFRLQILIRTNCYIVLYVHTLNTGVSTL
jgi:hypothetical protein